MILSPKRSIHICIGDASPQNCQDAVQGTVQVKLFLWLQHLWRRERESVDYFVSDSS